jgi:hypothetical protein
MLGIMDQTLGARYTRLTVKRWISSQSKLPTNQAMARTVKQSEVRRRRAVTEQRMVRTPRVRRYRSRVAMERQLAVRLGNGDQGRFLREPSPEVVQTRPSALEQPVPVAENETQREIYLRRRGELASQFLQGTLRPASPQPQPPAAPRQHFRQILVPTTGPMRRANWWNTCTCELHMDHLEGCFGGDDCRCMGNPDDHRSHCNVWAGQLRDILPPLEYPTDAEEEDQARQEAAAQGAQPQTQRSQTQVKSEETEADETEVDENIPALVGAPMIREVELPPLRIVAPTHQEEPRTWRVNLSPDNLEEGRQVLAVLRAMPVPVRQRVALSHAQRRAIHNYQWYQRAREARQRMRMHHASLE